MGVAVMPVAVYTIETTDFAMPAATRVGTHCMLVTVGAAPLMVPDVV